MTLADLTLPLPYEQAASLALVFSKELADRLVADQQEHGNPRDTINAAGPLSDGRYLHSADIVREYGIGPNGLYAAGFAHLNQERFGEVEVLPMAQVLALLPQPPEE